jgi:hypothetical protein
MSCYVVIDLVLCPCHKNNFNTSDTTFNALQYIVPVFNTSDELEDVLDVLTSNTSFNTSQYIVLIFGYFPIHPACIGMLMDGMMIQ